LEGIRDLVDWMILLRRERMTAAITEHDRLIDLLSRRDAKGARQAMKAHIRNPLKSALTSLKSGSP
jgi:DNA-binding GntR family transcriptional regulator